MCFYLVTLFGLTNNMYITTFIVTFSLKCNVMNFVVKVLFSIRHIHIATIIWLLGAKTGGCMHSHECKQPVAY